MKELVFTTRESETVTMKPIQVIERKGTQYEATLINRTISIKDNHSTVVFHSDIPTGKNRPGRKYAEQHKADNEKYLATMAALKKVKDILN